MRKRFGTVSLNEFILHEQGLLNPDNRWVKMVDVIDWEGLEVQNQKLMPDADYIGYPFRCVLGAVLLQDITQLDADELVLEVCENPYFQYFLGCKEFTHEEVFRKRDFEYFTKVISPKVIMLLEGEDVSEPGEEEVNWAQKLQELQNKLDALHQENAQLKLDMLHLQKEKKGLENQVDIYLKRLQATVQKPHELEVKPVPENYGTPMPLNKEQQAVMDMALNGKDLFITGGAGTGKSYLLQRIITNLQNKGMNVLVGAPTGMAAQHIKGATLHRLFSLGTSICEDLPVHKGNIDNLVNNKAYKIQKAANVLVIDEVSMCRADYFSRIIRVLDYEKKCGHHIQLILCGDFFQLAPVVGNRERDYFRDVLHNPDGWAFMTEEWKKMKLPICELKTVIRQSNPEFAKALNFVRKGNSLGLGYIVSHASGRQEESIYICGTNKKANFINDKELNEVGNPIQEYMACVYENKLDLDEDKEVSNVTDKVIRICDGARVILTKNDQSGLGLYHNGSTGTVVSHTDSSVTVLLDGTCERVEIESFNYQVFGYEVVWDKEQQRHVLKKKVVFAFYQLPIRLGWAITVHKSQGQTYEAMTLDTDSLWPADGLLYVALSRVTDTTGLQLAGGKRSSYQMKRLLKTSSIVQRFYENAF